MVVDEEGLEVVQYELGFERLEEEPRGFRCEIGAWKGDSAWSQGASCLGGKGQSQDERNQARAERQW